MNHRIEHGTIRSGAFDLSYSLEGSGRPALVVGSAAYYPRTFSNELRQHLQLAFVDHRGFAEASGAYARKDYSLETILSDMELMREKLGLGQVVVMGHSGHGFLALEYAKRYPQYVSHVVLIAMGPSNSQAHLQMTEARWQEVVCPERKQRFEADMSGLAEEISAAPDQRFITFCLRMGARSWHDPTFDARPLWQGVQVNMDVVDHLWGEAFRDLDITQGLEQLDKPVFLALGRFDYLVAPLPAWEPYREKFRDLTVRVFDQSSHTPQLEEAGLFDRELLDWLKRTMDQA